MISVIIVNYHLADAAIRAVQSLLPLYQQENIEIFLVDNSVSVHEADALSKAVGTLCQLIINDENIGFARACNQAYQQAQGEWILLLNPDAYLAAGTLSQLRDCLENTPSAAAVGSLVYWDQQQHFLLPPSIFPSHWDTYLNQPLGYLGGKITWLYSLKYRRSVIRYWQASQPLPQKNLSGGNVLLRRSAVEQAGGLFDPQFFLYYEDTDLFLRLRQANYQLLYLPTASAVHEFNSCPPEKYAWKVEQMSKSHQQFVIKHNDTTLLKPLIQKCHAFLARFMFIWQPKIIDLGLLSKPPIFPVAVAYQENWLMECSLSPYFIPAAGYFGQGKQAHFPVSAWEILWSGHYFVRIGAADKFWLPAQIWQWKIRL